MVVPRGNLPDLVKGIKRIGYKYNFNSVCFINLHGWISSLFHRKLRTDKIQNYKVAFIGLKTPIKKLQNQSILQFYFHLN